MVKPQMIRDARFLVAYMQEFMDGTPDASLLVNVDSRIVLANGLAEKLFGYGPGELHGQAIDALIPLRYRGLHSSHCARYFAKPDTRSMGTGFTLTGLRKDGVELPVDISLNALRTTDGTFVYAAIHDLSHTQQAVQAVLSQLAIGVVHSGLDGRVLDGNAKFCEMSGYSREELLMLGIRDLTDPEDLAQSRIARTALQEGSRQFYERETRLLRKGGERFWAHITTSIVRNRDGMPIHFLSAILDISAQKNAEVQLRQSEEEFRAVLEQSVAGILVIQDGKLSYVNPRMREIFGYSASEPFDADPLAHIVEDDRPKVLEQMKARLEGEAQASYSVHALRKDGGRFVLGLHATRATYRGRPAIITLAQDISAKVRAEEEIARHVVMLDQAMRSTIEVINVIGELRDPYTRGHERRVGELASAIAMEMGLDDDRVEGIRVAGYLHDVGKVGIPSEILAKPTRLTSVEFALVKEHAQKSYDILKGINFPWPVAQAAWQHHERLDGSGYPHGLTGEQIILEARILAVADTVEAMGSHRPYRPAIGIDKALAEIEKQRGRLYCPECADACLRLFRDKGYKLPI